MNGRRSLSLPPCLRPAPSPLLTASKPSKTLVYRDSDDSSRFSPSEVLRCIAGRYEEGAEHERRAVEFRPHFVTAWRTYAASAGMAANRGAAACALSQAKRLQSSLSVEWVEKHHGIVSPEDRAQYIRGLMTAGLE